MLIDSHCHIHFNAFKEDMDAVLDVCAEKGMQLIAIGTQQSTSENAIKLAEARENVYASVGLHPIQEYKIPVKEELDSFMTRGEQFDPDFYSALAAHPKVVAIGETGLDRYHIPKDTSYDVIFEKQKEVFLQHVAVAQEHDLPLVMHVRDAHKEMLQILEGLDSPIRGVIHCFTGGPEEAKRYAALGLYFGLGGVITYPPKKTDPQPQLNLLEALRHIPEDKMLVETDAPYLAPQTYRGKRCEPWMVEEVTEKLARLLGKSKEEIAALTTANAKALFTKMT